MRPHAGVALAGLALMQAVAVAAGAAGTRAAFAGLEQAGHVPVPALAALLLSGLALALLRPCLRLLGEAIGQAHVARLREALYDHAMRSDAPALAARRRGYLTMRITGDMAAMRDGLARGLPPLVQAAALLPTALAVLAVLYPPVAWLAAGIVLVCLAGFAALLPSLGRAQDLLRGRRARLAAEMTERLPLAPDLAALGRRTKEMRHIRRLSTELRAGSVGWLARAEGLHALPDALVAMLAAWTLYRGTGAGLVAGELAAMLAAQGILALALRDLAGAVGRIVAFRAASARVRAALARPALARPSGQVRLRRGAAAVEILDPSGAFLPDGPLRLEPGANDAVQATDPQRLAQILSRRAANPGLRIRIGDIPLDALSPGSIRRGIEVISDSPPVLRGSLRRCLTLGANPRPDDRLLLARIRRAGLMPALDRLGGLDARIEEGARLHSPADRILISVLRAAVRRPRLIVILPHADDVPPEGRDFVARSRATRMSLRSAPQPG